MDANVYAHRQINVSRLVSSQHGADCSLSEWESKLKKTESIFSLITWYVTRRHVIGGFSPQTQAVRPMVHGVNRRKWKYII